VVNPRSSSRTSNHILSQLSRRDFLLLEPNLSAIDLPTREQLAFRNRRIKDVYFMEAGIASVVADGLGRSIEIGIIGREGMTGLSVVMGEDRSPHDTYMQVAGSGQCISASRLREADQKSATLHRSFLRYVHAFHVQTAQTAVANGRSKIEERLARWLLMARDRLDSDELPLTHEFLAIMLGTRRPGVTVALHALERGGLVATARGKITILDRKALQESSNGIYAPPGR
jgi:CRP-like cAMP-binding protein